MDITVENIQQHPKELSDYTPQEKQFITEHFDEFNDEEKGAFSIFKETPGVTDDLPEDAAPVIPETPVGDKTIDTPEGSFTFKSQEEMDKYIQDAIDRRQAAKAAADEAAKNPTPQDPDKLFPDDYVPANPNQFAKDLLGKIEEKNQAAVKAQGEREDGYYQEYKTLIDAGKVPDATTPEGQEVVKQITNIALKHGKSSYTDAYELWSQIPEELGGGYKSTAAPVVDQKKVALKAQKNAASMVSGGSEGEKGSSGKKGDGMTYEQRHSMSLDQLIDKAMS